jgi:transcriptional regulator with XRE-family HTH domain
LGAQIQAARRERRWSQKELAGRAEITTPTLSKIEKGELGVAIGTVFEIAWLVGLPLFHDDPVRLALEHDGAQRAPAAARSRFQTGDLRGLLDLRDAGARRNQSIRPII